MALGLLVLLFNVVDNATTFLCLRSPVPGYEVIEANPLARWLFDSMGLIPGLVFEMAITTGAVGFLVLSPRIPAGWRFGLLVVLAVLPAYASFNNLQIMQLLGVAWAGS